MNARAQSADLLKGLAVIFMIEVHVMELFASPQILESSAGKFLLFLGGPAVAPVFAFFLGYFIFSSQKNTQQLLKRAALLFAIGMILNITLNLNLIISVQKGILNVNIWPYVFGVDILQFAGLALFIISLLKRIIEKYPLRILLLILVCVLPGTLFTMHVPENASLKYFSAFFYGSTNWSYFPLLPWLAYPLTGALFYLAKPALMKYSSRILSMPLVIIFFFSAFLAVTGQYAISVAANLQAYYHHGIVFYLWTVVFIVLYFLIINRVNTYFGNSSIIRYLKWAGKNVTGIYILQWIIIGNTATEIYKSISSPLYLAMAFIGILIACTVLCVAYLKIKEAKTDPI